ncbi:transglycosylase domain-containing protein [Haliangium sp.]|uniref:biosynthetic peptidoglycan transglycosylase n=1 Tax=Haliangium sp. TaxID=2663208 RepID=UPI003D0A023D
MPGVRERVLLIVTVAAAALVPIAARHHLDTRVRGELGPALSALMGTEVAVGAVDAELSGVVRLDHVDVGGMFTVAAVEAGFAPTLAELRAGRAPLRTLTLSSPRLHARVDRRGQSDVEQVVERLRPRLRAAMRAATRGRVDGLAIGNGPRPRIAVSGGGLVVEVEDCGQLEVLGVDIVPRRGGVRVLLAETDLALDCGGWQVRGSLGRAAADVALPAMAVERILAVGGAIDVATVDRERGVVQRPIELRELSVTRGVEGTDGTLVRGRIEGPGPAPEFTLRARRDREGVHAAFVGERVPLALFTPLVPRSVDLRRGTGDGRLEVSFADTNRLSVDAELSGIVVDDRRVTAAPLVLAGRIEAELAVAAPSGSANRSDDRSESVTIDIEQARFTAGALALTARGRVEYERPGYWLPDRGDLTLAVPRVACDEALTSLPVQMRDGLDGMRLRGELEAVAGLRFDRTATADTSLTIDVNMDACRVLEEAAGADPRRLLADFEHRVGNAQVLRLDPRAPGYVQLRRMPSYLPQAFVTSEDARFFHHSGFDLYQIERSLAVDLRDRAFVRGGSTISQQAVKNLFLSHQRTLARKLQEAVLTWRLESLLDKSQILERYLNIIELGPDVYGVEAAARFWFDKPARRLELREAAFLAALAPAPQTLSRRLLAAGAVDAAMQRRIENILSGLYRERAISERELRRAQRARLALALARG